MVRLTTLSAIVLLGAATASVCSAQLLQTDSTTAAATVLKLTGQVTVLRDNQSWALDAGSQVKPQQVIVTGPDGYAEFKCVDGSTFEVFPNSRVMFRNSPGDWKDLLEMLLGKVRVHIQKINGQPNNNRVRTPTAIISVRGTTFDIEVEEADTTFVYVEEGLVSVSHKYIGGEPKLLNPGEWLRVYKNAPIAQKMIDRGSIVRASMRAAAEAVYTTLSRTSRTPGGSGAPSGGGSGGGVPGDHGGKNPPPAPGGGTQPPPNTPPTDSGPNAPPPPGS